MRRALRPGGLALLLLGRFGGPALLAQVSARDPVSLARPALRVASSAGDIRIDGSLSEPAWQTADSIADLVQLEPVQGGTPTGRTVVRVLALRDALVIGVRADDPEPGRITSFARQRDASLTSEDHIRLVLDPSLDGRSGYVFIVNPAGARYEALVTDQGEGENANWDAVWEAATARSELGWSVEVRIPIKSLLYRRGATSWGFNVERRIQRLQETDRWASPDRDTKVNMTSRAGLLTDLPDFELGVGLSIRPSGTGQLGRENPAASTEHEQAHRETEQKAHPENLAARPDERPLLLVQVRASPRIQLEILFGSDEG